MYLDNMFPIAPQVASALSALKVAKTDWKVGDSALKFTLEPNGAPYVPSLNEIADYHEHQATWFPNGKDAQWHLQAAKVIREIGNEPVRNG